MNITGGKYNSRIIKVPSFDNIKPTLSKTRQGIFNTLASMTDFENKIFADLFAGSGIMGLEALSRGFEVYSFEKDRKTAAAVKATYLSLGETANLITGDCIKKFPESGIKADVVFIDPPYTAGLYDKILNTISSFPVLNDNAIIVVEHPENVRINNPDNFDTVKVKKYADKNITYMIFKS